MTIITPVRSIHAVLESEHIKNLLIGLAITFVAIEFGRAIYNVTFHPLAKFPGPFWAGVTPWWKTYEEVWKGNSLFHRLVDIHAQYGPIVRVSPNEVCAGLFLSILLSQYVVQLRILILRNLAFHWGTIISLQ